MVRFVIFFLLIVSKATAQTLGGAATYNFLQLPHSPLLSAAGGVNVSQPAADVAFALNNPAMLEASLNGRLALNFNSFFAGAKAVQLAGSYHWVKRDISLGGGVSYIDYGSIPQTDVAGNEQGAFRPKDFVLQASASKSYLERWRYGLSTKLIHSSYGQYRSTGLAFDVGLLYKDTANGLSAGIVAKNMGVQLTDYAGSAEELPFDLQAGVSKRLAKAPFGFSVTLQQAHRFNTLYNDTTFNSDNNFTSKSSFATKLFNHFVLATHLYLGKNLEGTVGYNFLRRRELNLATSGNGLNGFSAGFRAQFNKLEVQYARAYFSRSGAYNQFGIGLNLK